MDANRAEHHINMEEIAGGWHKQDVAKAQRDLVIKELSNAEQVLPFAAFMRAMDIIRLTGGTLLDIGCGCGHYGVLCERLYPGIHYHGTDVSAAMIAEAKQLAPLGRFRVCEFNDNEFGTFDIVLISQVVETMDDPPAMLKLALDNVARYVILNRIRITDKESHRIEETTYCGNIGQDWLWNMEEIEAIIAQYGKVLDRSIWDNENQATFVIERVEDGEPTIRSCCGDSCACS